MPSDDDIELKRLRLKRLRTLMAARSPQTEPKRDEKRSSVEELKDHLDERGVEVLNEAYQLNAAVVEKVANALVRAVREGKLQPPIDAGDLLRLFRSFGIPVRVSTSVKVLKDGEVKDLRKYLTEE
ncbi:MAG: hypothetical protein NZ957_03595 [Thaumarchaeota archaeon]|nr:hypothetical protein [Candidatus Calditenuaceae archaeon]